MKSAYHCHAPEVIIENCSPQRIHRIKNYFKNLGDAIVSKHSFFVDRQGFKFLMYKRLKASSRVKGDKSKSMTKALSAVYLSACLSVSNLVVIVAMWRDRTV